jgi:hypothetical protein
MSKRKNYEAPVGKGIDRATMLAQKELGVTNITVHQVTPNAWGAFYASDEGKARLNRMRTQNQMYIDYYKEKAAGKAIGETKADVRKAWEGTGFDKSGKVIAVNIE